jgi:hypothetical protein
MLGSLRPVTDVDERREATWAALIAQGMTFYINALLELRTGQDNFNGARVEI